MKHLIVISFSFFLAGYSFAYATAENDSLLQRLISLTVVQEGYPPKPMYLVNDSYVGEPITQNYDTVNNEAYKVFELIKDNYSISELRKLTNHELPNIRVYAFWGLLLRREYRICQEVLDQHKNDTSLISYVGMSDLIQSYTVYDFMKSWYSLFKEHFIFKD